MKYVALAVLAFLLVGFSPASLVTFSSLRGTPESDSILLQWSTSAEDGVRYFEVDKASQLNNQFYPIGEVNAAGAGNSYQYSDVSIYKTTSSSVFQYRICAVGTDGTSRIYSSVITVSYDNSGLSGIAKKTWGSIKAMFR